MTVLISTATLSPQRRCLTRLSVRVHRAIAHAYHDSVSSKCLSMLVTTLCHRSKCQRRHLSPLSVSVHTYHHSLSASILITTLCHRSKCLRRHLSPLCQRRYLSPLCQRSKCMSALWQRSKGQCRCLSRHSVSVQSDGVDAQFSTTLCNCSKQHQSRPRTDSSAGAGEIVVFLCTRDNPRTFSLGRYRQAPSGRKPVTPEKQTPRWTL